MDAHELSVAEPPDLETLQAAVGYLMTRHCQRASPGVMNGVIFHLQLLVEHPQVQASQVLRSAYWMLLQEWRGLAARQAGCAACVSSSNAGRLH
jgi:hypothetical protein